MKIIAVSFLWSGLKNFFIKGEEKSTGMPAFYEVLIRLLESPKLKQLDLILVYDGEKVDWVIPKRFEGKLNIIGVKLYPGWKQVITILSVLTIGLRRILSNNYSRYLGFGSISFVTYVFKLIKKRPDQRRLYGISTVFEDLKKSKVKIFLKHPLSFLSIWLKANELFITNDGSKGDQVFKKIGNKKTHFNFLFNGVNESNVVWEPKNFCSFIGRVYPWKGQIHLIRALAELKKKYGVEINAKIVGQLSDEKYLIEMKKIVEENDLGGVEFISEVSREEVNNILSNSTFTLSFYQTSNFGNVLIEALKVGVPIVTANVNNSLSSLPENCYLNVDDYSSESIAEKIKYLLENKSVQESLSENSLQFAKHNFVSWEERAMLEVQPILG